MLYEVRWRSKLISSEIAGSALRITSSVTGSSVRGASMTVIAGRACAGCADHRIDRRLSLSRRGRRGRDGSIGPVAVVVHPDPQQQGRKARRGKSFEWTQVGAVHVGEYAEIPRFTHARRALRGDHR